MKKLVCVILVLTLLNALSVPVARAEESVRGLTLMIYMCGSNLESEYGSATADIQEMLDSGYDARQTSVLVMAGGAAGWSYAFDPEKLSISELTPRSARIVWSESAQNMGTPETLTRLLTFGVENYPAREYALILWDHGGGPLEGVCWDELFSMDNLSLSELSRGIEDAAMPGKLKWIGFDACLMCSAEVASAMSPYAEYMIASQETEPAKGWNYAFLNGIENDVTGADTGRRIVDCYFEGLSDSQYILTMACIDLSKIDGVLEEMDAFFSPIGENMDEEAFIRLSGLRRTATGFGKAVRGVGEDGYDLVDLNDLVSHYGTGGTSLNEAISDAVVCIRSSEEGACGLSVYHPYSNKSKYLESWHEDYRDLDFSAGYVRYVESFGTLLTGVQIADWRGLYTEYTGQDENGVHDLSLQLSDLQVRDFASAQLMILKRNKNISANVVFPVSVEPTQLDASGMLNGKYASRSLYVEDETGEVLEGPISFLLTDDGEYYVIPNRYSDNSGRNRGRDETYVLHYCTLDPETDRLDIVQTYVYDIVSGSFTNRISFDETDFTQLAFFETLRYPPDSDGALPAFSDWIPFDGYAGRIIDLPRKWHLHFRTDLEPIGLYATFQVTDLQQNTYSSTLVPLESLNEIPLTIEPAETEFTGGVLSVSGTLNPSTLYPGVGLSIEIENTSDANIDISSTYLVINGTHMTNEMLFAYDLEPGKVKSLNIDITADELYGIEKINSIECVLSSRVSDDYTYGEIDTPVYLEFSDGCDVSVFAMAPTEPLSEFTEDGVTWQLISLEQESDGSFTGYFHVQNDTDEDIKADGNVLINGLRCDDQLKVNVYAHTDAYTRFEMENRAALSLFILTVSGIDRLYLLGMTELLERSGSAAVERVDLLVGQDDIFHTEGKAVHFDLSAEIPLANAGGDMPVTSTILEGDVSAEIETFLVADDGIGFGLWIENDSDEFICLSLTDPDIDGMEFGAFDWGETVVVPAHTRVVKCFSLNVHDEFAEGDLLHELSFRFKYEDQVSETAVIRFPNGTVFGASGGTYLDVSELEVTPAVFDSSYAETEKAPIIGETPIFPDAIRPIHVSAPLSEDEKKLVKSVSAHIALIGYETADGVEYLTSRILVFGEPMEKDDDGNWSKEFSGLALCLGGQPLTVVERKQEDGSVKFEAEYNSVYLFHNAEDFEPAEDLWSSSVSVTTFDFTLDISTNGIDLIEEEIEFYDWGDMFSDRTDFYLREFEMAICEYGVHFGVDRAANADTLDYYDFAFLPLDDTLVPEFVPIADMDVWLGVYFFVEYEDGTRADRIVDLRTGEILESAVADR